MRRGAVLLSSRDCRYYGDLCSIGHAGREIVKESHVLAVDIDVDEPSQLAGFFAKTGSEPWILVFERFDYIGDSAGRYFNGVGITSDTPQRCRNSNLNGHCK